MLQIIVHAIGLAMAQMRRDFSPEEIARRELIGFGIIDPTWEDIRIKIETGEIRDTKNKEILYIPPTKHFKK